MRFHEPQVAATEIRANGRLGRGAFIRLGRFFFRWRKFAFPLVAVVVALTSKPTLPFGSEAWDRVFDAAGIALAVAGQTLRAAVIGLAYIRRGGNRGRIHADTLVQEGIFAHSRNPLYLGNLLEFTGMFLILNSPAGYLIGLPFFLLAYASIVLAEEEFLRGRFGGLYEEYCARVNRFLPSLRGLGATLRSMEFDWKRLIRKEYGTTFVWISVLLALLAWENYAQLGWPESRPAVRGALVAWAILVVCYATARYLKKTGRLESP